jgi:thiosulfate/3-mercaptopyruvate sulfurtransferase
MRSLAKFLFALLMLVPFFAFQQEPLPWTENQLVAPADLAKILNDPSAKKPAIICVGPVDLVKTAVLLPHAASTLSGMEDLKYLISKYPKTKEVILYCGCCKLKTCPNIKPAFEYLKANGYVNAKVLNLPANLDEDWKEKGYPMEK